ncbi:aminoglycoside phosphotransferase family protein [Streptacidiphilus jiangxiensis]|uniref:Predicted kinase, aminoglycoside phosphotransferase (APT) family n=1 Tax=Streptacidiphilus jiangxiensis TaxID=235985 RepID=A0A1H7S0U2_STRJI|nr:aminoglycoside phosphotransferase family protein [Streptacidiphilus jiangxiensis]SEL66210.1 Predicted kinase, aminoglycoside phosphotransferase (APT) family [Streptacidiphilus jiangxiensis]
MATDRLSEELRAVVEAALPGERLDGARVERSGGSHDVVLLPGVAAVRVARTATARAELPRTVELHGRLAALDLPFAVPRPLSALVEAEGRAGVALTWLDGAPTTRGEGGEPAQLAALLDALRGVDLRDLDGLLGAPHQYAGGERWSELLLEEVVPRLPQAWQVEARRRVVAALELEPVDPSLVHGDLAGANVHWGPDGRLLGVLDWDLAQPFDPALDAACLSWHGWDKVRAAVDGATLRRAWTWYRTFALEVLAHALVNGESGEALDRRTATTVAALERSAARPRPF